MALAPPAGAAGRTDADEALQRGAGGGARGARGGDAQVDREGGLAGGHAHVVQAALHAARPGGAHRADVVRVAPLYKMIMRKSAQNVHARTAWLTQRGGDGAPVRELPHHHGGGAGGGADQLAEGGLARLARIQICEGHASDL